MEKTIQNIVIIGGTKGIGYETAVELKRKGNNVIVGGRSKIAIKELTENEIPYVPIDVTKKESIDLFFVEISKYINCIDVLINNAGYGFFGAVENIDIQTAKQQFDTNLFGLIDTTRTALPLIRLAANPKIFFMSSLSGKVYFPLSGWYNASKFALEGVANCLRLELSNENIKVVLIQPGAVKTDFQKSREQSLLLLPEENRYYTMYNKVVSANEKVYKRALEPKAVAHKVAILVTKKRPKPQILIGTDAKLLNFTYRFLGVRVYDYIIKRMYKGL